MSTVDPRPDSNSASPDGAAAIAVRVAAVREYLEEVRGERDRATAQWLSAREALKAEQQALRTATEELEQLRAEVQRLTADRAQQLEEARAAATELDRRLTIRDAEAVQAAAEHEGRLRSECEAHAATRAELYRSRRDAVSQKRRAASLQRELEEARAAATELKRQRESADTATQALHALEQQLAAEQEVHAATRAELDRVSGLLALRSSQLEAIRAGRAYQVMRRVWRIRARMGRPLGGGKRPKQLPSGDSGR